MHSGGAEHHEVLWFWPLLDLCMFSVSQSTHSLGSYDVKYIPKDIDETVSSTWIKHLFLPSFTPSKILDSNQKGSKHTLRGMLFMCTKYNKVDILNRRH